jgi:hypothetical protein
MRWGSRRNYTKSFDDELWRYIHWRLEWEGRCWYTSARIHTLSRHTWDSDGGRCTDLDLFAFIFPSCFDLGWSFGAFREFEDTRRRFFIFVLFLALLFRVVIISLEIQYMALIFSMVCILL